MPRIVFTEDPKLPADLKHLGFKKGTEVELPIDQCERWIRRLVAVYVKKTAPIEAGKVASPSLTTGESAVVVAFDPQTAPIEDVRQFLTNHGRRPHPSTSEARLREMAAAIPSAS
jgi:hypothetical protein